MVTPDSIAVALGRPAPSPDAPEWAQWSMWIEDALMLIKVRHSDLTLLDQSRLEYVVREAVVAQIRRPEDLTSVTVSIDDGSQQKTYRSGAGRVAIRDEWWDLLAPSAPSSGAFSINTVPQAYVGLHADICSLWFGGLYCSCGLVLTMNFPEYNGIPHDGL